MAACEVDLGESGLAVGVADCEAGICAVPAGPFVMGAAEPAFPDQCPPRWVELSAFSIDQTEVTRAAWSACHADGACPEAPPCESVADVDDPDQLPVACVDHAEAAAFCAWAGGRLPTEAEWEKAARGDDGAPWAWGPQPPSCVDANFRFNSAYCKGGLVEVGSYEFPGVGAAGDSGRSAYGLLDTVGNAWEWTADWYDAGYYRRAPDRDPPGPDSCSIDVDGELAACRYQVLRGGAYNTTQDTTRGSARSFGEPGLRDVNLGFRCAYP